ncbi:uncharacterized protein pim [Drosophila kikkawai]|uniref:Uncharacterized protein pim n=1 Tax=Drosophila kikkawai TaxID=30033 RepID=A0A6P4IQN3_DROKI|nr:uncharacterized protein LOC108077112 [Drosophila kikkawai]
MDQIINKENAGVYLPSNPMKNGVPLGSTALKQTVKKSVLGKLDNVMHLTPGITPFKSSNAVKLEGSIAKLSIQKAAKQMPANLGRDREEVNVKSSSCFLGSYMVRRDAIQPINLFNYTDFPTERCAKQCSKPITETWLEKQCDFDDLCERILHDMHTLEEDWNNEEIPQLGNDFDENPPLYNLDSVENEECESFFDLPLPSFVNVDILF